MEMIFRSASHNDSNYVKLLLTHPGQPVPYGIHYLCYPIQPLHYLNWANLCGTGTIVSSACPFHMSTNILARLGWPVWIGILSTWVVHMVRVNSIERCGDTKNQILLGAAVAILSRMAHGMWHPKSIINLVQLSPFCPGGWWECNTQK